MPVIDDVALKEPAMFQVIGRPSTGSTHARR